MNTPDLKAVAGFFNNQSVGAFLGAFAAFMLVAANDWRRERRKVRTLRAEIEVNLADVEAKLETVRRLCALMREHNRVMPSPILRFNTAFTRQLAGDVLHLLYLDQRRAVEGLCYTMEVIDGVLVEALSLSQKFTCPLGQAERIATAEHLLANFSNNIANPNRLIEMCQQYLAGRYAELVRKQYNAARYDKP